MKTLLKSYEEEKSKLNELEKNYKIMKHTLETNLLVLKYSEEFQQYKTIKEKEERAKIELAPFKSELIQKELELNNQKLIVEVLGLDLREMLNNES